MIFDEPKEILRFAQNDERVLKLIFSIFAVAARGLCLRRISMIAAPARWLSRVFVSFVIAAAFARSALAMGEERFGPVGKNISRSSDWPKGVEDMLRDPSRVYSQWVNGNEAVYFDGNVDAINRLLDLYSHVDVNPHVVVIRPGKGTAKSFQGKETSYAVEFQAPSGIYLHFIRELAKTGLYTTAPLLIIQVDEKLADHLGDLKLPANVSVRAATFRIDDALAQIDAADRSLRWHAISLLGGAGDSSPAVLEKLNRAAGDADESINKTAKAALEQIERANQAEAVALRQKVAAFVKDHSQSEIPLDATGLLDALRAADAEYAKGFTARGTLVRPAPAGRSMLMNWTVTMGDDKTVIEERAVEDDDHPPKEGRFQTTIYTSPKTMANVNKERLWIDGKLQEAKAYASFEPVGVGYDIFLGRMFWPLGRGFSRRLERIATLKPSPDGMLDVFAESGKQSLGLRWHLKIDPSAGYLVRSARGFKADEAEPSYATSNLGMMSATGRFLPHTAQLSEGASSDPVSISVIALSNKPDLDLIQRTEKMLSQLPHIGQ
jgi:hypothetical protein